MSFVYIFAARISFLIISFIVNICQNGLHWQMAET